MELGVCGLVLDKTWNDSRAGTQTYVSTFIRPQYRQSLPFCSHPCLTFIDTFLDLGFVSS